MSKSFLGNASLPRGLRNNNPGNLVITQIDWQGKIPLMLNTDKHFEQFENVHYGIRAMMRDLYNDYTKKGKNTVTALISEYAPSFENNTSAYIQNVIKFVGSDYILTLDKTSMINMARAVHFVENGSSYFDKLTDSDFETAYNMAFPNGLSVTAPEKKNENSNLILILLGLLFFMR